MKKTALILFILLLALNLQAQTIFDQAPEKHPLIALLELAPSNASFVNYVDFAAAENAGAFPLEVDSYASIADTDAEVLWAQRLFRIRTGPEYFRFLFNLGPAMPETVGFDLFDIDQTLTFGSPPENGQIFRGTFDFESVREAHAARDYTREQIAGAEAWCGPDGCDSGLEVNYTDLEDGNVFDPRLGRKPPVILHDDEFILSAYDLPVARGMAAAAQGDFLSLAEVPTYRAIADALTADDLFPGNLVQMHYLAFDSLNDSVDLSIFATREDYDRATDNLVFRVPLVVGWADYGVLPVYELAALADFDAGDEQQAVIALAYRTQEDAEQAAEELTERVQNFNDAIMSQPDSEPLVDFIDGAQLDSPQVFVSERTGLYVAVVAVTYPFVEAESIRDLPEGVAPPGFFFQQWLSSYFRRGFYPLWQITLPDWPLEE